MSITNTTNPNETTFGAFTDVDGHRWARYVVFEDRREWVVWDNRAASTDSRHATRPDAETCASLLLAKGGRR